MYNFQNTVAWDVISLWYGRLKYFFKVPAISSLGQKCIPFIPKIRCSWLEC